MAKNDKNEAEPTIEEVVETGVTEAQLNEADQERLKSDDFVLDPVFGVQPKDAETMLRLRAEGKL